MPSFFFDYFDGMEVIEDVEGKNFDSLEAAEVEADDTARELAAAVIIDHRGIDSREIRVREAGGLIVWAVRFKDVVN